MIRRLCIVSSSSSSYGERIKATTTTTAATAASRRQRRYNDNRQSSLVRWQTTASMAASSSSAATVAASSAAISATLTTTSPPSAFEQHSNQVSWLVAATAVATAAIASDVLLDGGDDLTFTEGPLEEKANDDHSVHPTQPTNTPSSSGEWKDGLLYDDPQFDEPTTCVFCNLYRQGPCRPYWRPFEQCVKQQQQQQLPSPPTTNNDDDDQQLPHKDDRSCEEISKRFIMECLSNYMQLYALVDLQTWQDELFDMIESTERQSAYQDIWAVSDKNNSSNNSNSQATDATTAKAGVLLGEDDDNDTSAATTTTTTTSTKIPQRVFKVLQNEQLYQHVQDCLVWSESIRIDWSRWATLVQGTHWTKAELEHMLQVEREWLEQQQYRQEPIRPVWWNTAPSLANEGIDQILDFMTSKSTSSSSSSNTTTTTSLSSPPPLQPSVPWPFLYRPVESTPSTSSSSSKPTTESHQEPSPVPSSSKPKLEGRPFWHLLQNQNPILVPIVVTLPKKHPSPGAHAAGCQLQYAYCRDAETGVLLGYYYPSGKSDDQHGSSSESSSESASDADNTTTSSPNDVGSQEESKQPPSSDIADDADPKVESSKDDVPKEDESTTTASSTTTTATTTTATDDSTIELMVQVLPGKTSSIQLFGAYASDDSYEFLETPPIRLVDSIFVKNHGDNNEDVVIVRDTPQGLEVGDLRERFEKYQLLHNFCKFQNQLLLAADNNTKK